MQKGQKDSLEGQMPPFLSVKTRECLAVDTGFIILIPLSTKSAEDPKFGMASDLLL
jgi:hypothetical protein